MWLLFAILSSIFAALTSILAKVGINNVNSNLATAIRTVVVLVMSWGMVFLTNAQTGIANISKKSWTFLILSGIATGASWLFYYKALQVGDVSKVVPIDKLSVVITLLLAFIFLHEQFSTKSIIGAIFITIGTLLMIDSNEGLVGVSKMVYVYQANKFYEQDYYTPSEDGFKVYDTPFGKIGIVICFDRHLPESIRSCAKQGAELIIIPTANTLDEPMEMFEWEIRVQAYQNIVTFF